MFFFCYNSQIQFSGQGRCSGQKSARTASCILLEGCNDHQIQLKKGNEKRLDCTILTDSLLIFSSVSYHFIWSDRGVSTISLKTSYSTTSGCTLSFVPVHCKLCSLILKTRALSSTTKVSSGNTLSTPLYR